MRINRRLGLAFAATALLLFASALVAIGEVQDALRRSLGEKLLLLSQQTMATVDREVMLRVEALESLAEALELAALAARAGDRLALRPDRREYVAATDARWAAGESLAEADAALAHPAAAALRRFMVSSSDARGGRAFTELYVTDRHGVVFATSGRTSDMLQADEEWYRAAAAQRRFWVGDVEYDRSSGAYSVDLVLRLVDGSGEFAGILKGVLDVTVVRRLVDAAQERSGYRSLVLRLVDRRGYLISSHAAGPGDAGHDPRLEEFGTVLARWAEVRRAVPIGPGFALLEAGDWRHLVSYVPSQGFAAYPGLDWALVGELDGAEVFAPLSAAQGRMALGFGFAAVVALVLGVAVTRSIARPLMRMRDAAMAIGKGRFHTRVEEGDGGEIGQLGAALNRMAEELSVATVSKSYVDSILGSMSDLLVMVSEDGVIRVINQAACTLLGYRPDELVGEDLGVICRDPFLRDPALTRLVLSGTVSNLEEVCTTRDGQRVPVLFSAVVMRDPDDRSPQGIILVGVDIDRRMNPLAHQARSERLT